MKIFRLFFGTYAIIFLSACVFFPKQPIAIDTFDLTRLKTFKNDNKAQKTLLKQIVISQPIALKIFDSENILIKSDPLSIKFLSSAQWSDRLPKIIQARLSEAFQESYFFKGIGKPGEGISADYEIISEIRHFEVVAGKTKSAYIELFVKILEDRDGVIVDSRAFKAEKPVLCNKNACYIKAMDDAFSKIVLDIVNWVKIAVS